MLNSVFILSIYSILISILIFTLFVVIYFFIYLVYIFLFLPTELEFNIYNYIGNKIKTLFKGVSQNFPITFLNRNSIKNDKKYLYVFIPHGLITISQIIHNFDPDSELNKLNIYNGVHSYIYRIPLLREMAQMCGGIPVDKSVINTYLKKGSVSITVGGAREISYALDNEQNDKLFIRKRKGFIKIAQDNSVEIVPIYCWNEQQFLTTSKWHVFEILNKLLTLLLGRYFDLNSFQTFFPANLIKIFETIIGKVKGTKLYVGEPINLSKYNLDEAHSIYINKVQELFKYAAQKENSNKLLIIE